LAQRLGAWIIGLVVMALSVFQLVEIAGSGSESRSWIGVIASLFATFIGLRVFRNGFRRRGAESPTLS
jgi:hypothetical protein